MTKPYDTARLTVNPIRSPGPRRSLLVVDDNLTLRTLTVGLLDSAGYACDPAGTVREAVDRIRAADYDLVIADFGLPDGTALDLVEQFTDSVPRLRVVVLSAAALPQLRQVREHPCVVDVWAKPLRRDALLGKVAGLVVGPCPPVRRRPAGEALPSVSLVRDRTPPPRGAAREAV